MVAIEEPTTVVTEEVAAPQTRKNELAVLDANGHSTHEWDPEDAEQVAAIRALFERMVTERHYLAFRMEPGGQRGEQIREFDPDAEKMILTPPMQGG